MNKQASTECSAAKSTDIIEIIIRIKSRVDLCIEYCCLWMNIVGVYARATFLVIINEPKIVSGLGRGRGGRMAHLDSNTTGGN